MKAVVYHRPKAMSVDTVKDPGLKAPTDVILKVTSTAICGSDLHIYNGFLPQPRPIVMGHEFMGVVEEVGKDVRKWKRGDRVVVPFPIACGTCFFCNQNLHIHCERSNEKNYGPEGGILREKGGALFGYTDMYGGYDGGQAEYVRVPFADVGPRKVPDGLKDEQVLFLTDIFPTGYSAIQWAEMKGGETVAVFGCGPVGIMAMKAAWLRGAKRVIGVDREDYRLKKAEETARAETINPSKADVVEVIRSMTDGRGADVVVDAVGLESHRSLGDKVSNLLHLQMGSIDTLKACFSSARRGGSISIVGVYGLPYDNFPIGQIFDKGLRISTGQAHVHKFIDELIAYVVKGKVRLDDVISHVLPLEEAPRGYEMFNQKKDDCVKVVLKPAA